MKYSYLELKEDLSIGHEVEFLYNGEKYSISHNEKGWYLTKFSDNIYQSFCNSEELLKKALINNKRIEEIWDNVVVESVF
ncbi:MULTISPECIES: hypothetical protein [Thermoanaerobacterium]|uniref:Uncharacterized protein n=2 Tax=Thermoanaerobacterium TaxID=28895 RepID=W9EEJ0_9THEO|nr:MULTISPECIES: hypothetical protein [Thermoanaerobacterium]AFK85432.1 hypothetical protein Tsac_0402 [Thermoanaerobacterium saccharolyticum JW/SL-YS485]ETO39390.1 hypothetical protein V518_0430 [Thermoanaerobacterium aotearoense SCUT27]